ncbi:MAG: FHA domain-containing protein [Planctomycetes bacterium]|nr:FHA domain-containing protein [Planctomycetota bacterium]
MTTYGLDPSGCQLVTIVKQLRGVDKDDFLLEVPYPCLLEIPTAGPLPAELGFPMSTEPVEEAKGSDPLATVKINVSEIAGLRRSSHMQKANVHLLRPAVDGEAVSIGRADECDVTLDSEGVSRQHAKLHVAAGNWMLEDLGSHNGTRVDGTDLESGAKVALNDRHQLLFGSYRGVFMTPERLFDLASMLAGRPQA